MKTGMSDQAVTCGAYACVPDLKGVTWLAGDDGFVEIQLAELGITLSIDAVDGLIELLPKVREEMIRQLG